MKVQQAQMNERKRPREEDCCVVLQNVASAMYCECVQVSVCTSFDRNIGVQLDPVRTPISSRRAFACIAVIAVDKAFTMVMCGAFLYCARATFGGCILRC